MLESHADCVSHNSRQSIKKYVKSNNDLSYASPAVFDNQFNKAVKAGADKGEFTQPKGKLHRASHIRRPCAFFEKCRVTMRSTDASFTSRSLGSLEACQEGTCCEACAQGKCHIFISRHIMMRLLTWE